ncbi:glycosyl hydrolase 115 family protein [Catenovulum adriaticum]|uniref:Glycosyl hydrolase 115 family protein n=1 Tax=Catenovulum adriaticum TaxID=2984846 RepID=A0ABY7ARL8_9ALTE|nr:glycosyl hydrolase 115 family protein [Catenovulum sp. TS8]WAJ71903.1 glycosyl hydrolase 115 family protein [Catenovulum sp. TS8]
MKSVKNILLLISGINLAACGSSVTAPNQINHKVPPSNRMASSLVSDSLAIELESLSAQDAFTPYSVKTDGFASGGEYILKTPGLNATAAIPFSLDKKTDLEFQLRIKALDSGENTVYYRLNSGDWKENNKATVGDWSSVLLAEFEGLNQGQHTLYIQSRNTNTALDKAILNVKGGKIALGKIPSNTPEIKPHLGLKDTLITEKPSPGDFKVFANGKAAPIWLDDKDWEGVHFAADDLQADINRVGSITPKISKQESAPGKAPIIIGTIGKSALIDSLIAQGKLDVTNIEGQWENFVIEAVDNPASGVEQALVIAGSDKRGTIFGIYELSEQLGVSPWYWWADVPSKQREQAYIVKGRYESGSPAVQYRGIFLNDEAPALTGWSDKKFGGRNSKFYAHVFELILRMRGNFLWPAMWSDDFNTDDPLNPVLADQYGIVMSTSHHEPMMQQMPHWYRNSKKFGNGKWSYVENEEGMKQYFREGLERTKDFENVITLSMRGDGDHGLKEASVELLEKVVGDQRQIIEEVTGKPASERPTVWALYKEVQYYYDEGMNVPDDVTLLYCDDNWGNIRTLPDPNSTRTGGSGLYYHFDYHGGPRSYKWHNTTPIEKVYEQMSLAARYNANKIWVVNVGDLKPMEVPIEFFLRMAWEPERWDQDTLDEYLVSWTTREFGADYAQEAAGLITEYTKYLHWRKPELTDSTIFSVENYREAERVNNLWKSLAQRADKLMSRLPESKRDAAYQLFVYPIKAMLETNNLYYATARNKLYAQQKRASTNELAEQAKQHFDAVNALRIHWNEEFADGRWVHMMDQAHIGATSWKPPKENIMTEVRKIDIPNSKNIGVMLEGSDNPMQNLTKEKLPELSAEGGEKARYFDVYRMGSKESRYQIKAEFPWVSLSHSDGSLDKDIRVEVSVNDWSKVPEGNSNVFILVKGLDDGSQRGILLPLNKPKKADPSQPEGFLDVDGYIAIEAPNADRKIASNGISWAELPNHGRGQGAMRPSPDIFPTIQPTSESARLEYDMYISRLGEISVDVIVSPTLNLTDGKPMHYAIAFDNQKPQLIEFAGKSKDSTWTDAVRDSVRKTKSFHNLTRAGFHTLKIWAVDPGFTIQKIEIDTGNLKNSYLGPQQSPRGNRVPIKGVGIETGATVVVEAESGVIGSDFNVSRKVLPYTIDIKSNSPGGYPEDESRVSTYTVNFKEPGVYNVYARIRVGGGRANDDSLFLAKGFGVKSPSNGSEWSTVNGLFSKGYTNMSETVDSKGNATTGVWKWVLLTSKKSTYKVSKDNLTQTFQIGGRENGLEIDKFVFGLTSNTFTVDDLLQGAAGKK